MRYSKPIPLVSILVCHHKGDLIYDFVKSVQKSLDITFEIFVATSDDNIAINGIPGCYTFNCYDGPAEKRNKMARMAKGKYLAIFDDDVEVSETCIAEMIKTIESRDDIGMVYGKLYKYGAGKHFDEAGGYLTSTGFIWSRAGQNILDTGQYDNECSIFAGKSASCLVKAEVWHKCWGMDEDFWILGEESDLSWRMWLFGYRVYWCPKSVAYHKFNTPLKPANDYYTSKRVHFNGCRNYITMLIKNLETRNLWKILPLHISIWIGASLAMIFTGKVTQGLNILRGIGYTLWKVGFLLEKRRLIQLKRVRTDDELFAYVFCRAPRGYYTQRFTRYFMIGLHG